MIRRRPQLRIGRARAALLFASAVVGSVAIASAMPSATPLPSVGVVSLAERLEPHTWAFAIPLAWLAAPMTGLREGDVLDLIGTRTSERATASEVAAGLRVISVDERTLVVELTAEDATAIAEARARGLSFVPILRSSQ